MMKRILVVDDEYAIRVVLADALSDYEIVAAAGGADAVRFISDGSFDLLITDIRMPDIDGVQIAKFWRERNPDLPVIAITGFSEERIWEELRKQGVRAIFRKPFSLQELSLAVQEMIGIPDKDERERNAGSHTQENT